MFQNNIAYSWIWVSLLSIASNWVFFCVAYRRKQTYLAIDSFSRIREMRRRRTWDKGRRAYANGNDRKTRGQFGMRRRHLWKPQQVPNDGKNAKRDEGEGEKVTPRRHLDTERLFTWYWRHINYSPQKSHIRVVTNEIMLIEQ